MVTGLPLIAGGPSLFAQSRAGRGGGAGAQRRDGIDPLFAFTLRELGRIQSRARAAHAMRGEDARTAALQLRTVALYAQELDLDSSVKRGLRAAVANRGRDAIMYAPVDKVKLAKGVEPFGLRIDDFPDAGAIDYPTRAARLDALLAGGITPSLSHAADVLDASAVVLDRQASVATGGMLRVQSWTTGFCDQIQRELNRLQAELSATLAAAFFNPDLLGAAYLITGAIGVQTVAQGIYC
ncbi:MAG TPA: hypothetical protein VG871_08415 [Vicinamibacterales bacterium]|nr:hypothetical protein [Vicinamibacterales bacterium]